MAQPIVLIPACTKHIGAHPYHVAQMKYIDAVVRGSACVPLILPALGEELDWETVLQCADGVMLTGSPSNVHPDFFGQSVLDPSLPLDPARDATTLPLIRMAIQRGIPLLAVCRGTQEVNVALGGTLHQAVHEVEGFMDHREDKTASLDIQYAPAHNIKIMPNGRIAHILHGVSEMMVNSVHGQGIDQLAPGLQIEALAEDGLIEAYSVANAPGFTLAMQWHPEWKITENPLSMKLFDAFGAACREFKLKK
ncbi:gamma-glutamyl-gamma-aminobutyrate hydrolase family protein [Solimicrobium silvestre]|uniref:gamma-glutamyl-gamma-aminobutyrate hydrolase n=1 Tax=Solimicrobium silvestre TaxID=2099400 RepID=A0A2S9H3L8_9BURK|nr:gamma-glutamyl-gamma-aminobutyrate hydrolase family protein [Solimicrobium silvestre]PRC94568.1 putative glutamine amidotransferase [Solimicrobium silvestre]